MRLLPGFHKVRDSLPDEFVAAKDWRRRIATLAGAVLIGLAALGFAWAGDRAQHLFFVLQAARPWVNVVMTPMVFVAIALVTARYAPQTRGSGIPQVIAAARAPDSEESQALVSLKTAIAKVGLTVAGLFGGAAVGREGPTVQLAAALMVQVHKLLRVPLTAGVLIAGGAAGVAAAFNTPLAGIAFAIEELAVAYEQRVAVLVMGAVMISGLTAQGIAGDYVYFGELNGALEVKTVIIAAPLAGIGGGVLGGLFSRLLLAMRGKHGRWSAGITRRPLVTALVCGLVVGAIGWATGGATSGTGYGPTAMLLEGRRQRVLVRPGQVRQRARHLRQWHSGRDLRALAGDRSGLRRSADPAIRQPRGRPDRSDGDGRILHRRRPRAADCGDHSQRGDREQLCHPAAVRDRADRRLGRRAGVPRPALSQAGGGLPARSAARSGRAATPPIKRLGPPRTAGGILQI